MATYSYLVTENLPKIAADDSRKKTARSKISKEIENYLKLVRGRFDYYERLLVYDIQGNIIAQSPQLDRPTELPENWQEQLQTKKAIIGEVHNNDNPGIPMAMIAIPVLSADGNNIGLFAADLDLSSLHTEMDSLVPAETAKKKSTKLMLLQKNGTLLVSTDQSGINRPARTQAAALYNEPLKQA